MSNPARFDLLYTISRILLKQLLNIAITLPVEDIVRIDEGAVVAPAGPGTDQARARLDSELEYFHKIFFCNAHKRAKE